ncbi:PTS sugar transporter subunit IIA [Pectinatus haikarae]|uniref:Mannose/fructose/sorbose-specific phosphotransferase system IIA component n=1 Tax=Pectinatus haikarae TaxID=349096 RepID=A0ABT9YAB7_9FIRM|nr:PTS sugar transporter subunit IIA [Pectinatus haikarae]MDQ0204787.1 mannose/fructose/sorbose-specific phosphotransferase system IIA component [Pectinatus haikarae]
MKIILASHGHLARELLNSAEMICGKQQNIGVIEFIPGDDLDKLKRKFSECMDDSVEILIITDIFGGTPYNIAAGFALQNKLCMVIAGGSLPMLLDVLTLCSGENISAKKLTEIILSNKINYVRFCEKLSHLSELEEL